MDTGFNKRKSRAAAVSLFSCTILVICKFSVALYSGSVSVLSEALHSLTDLLAVGFTWISVKISNAPPDQAHPYGHGKFENLSAFLEAIFIFVGASLVIVEAVQHLLHPTLLDFKSLVSAKEIMVLSVITSLGVGLYLRNTAKVTQSQALDADGKHLLTDVISSTGVLTALIIASSTRSYLPDVIVGLLVASLMLWAGIGILKSALHPLLDTRLPNIEEERIRAVLETDTRVLGYHKLRTRMSGMNRDADVHVMMDDAYTLSQAHSVAEELEDKIRTEIPFIHISIHVEPFVEEMRHLKEMHPTERINITVFEENRTHVELKHSTNPGD